MTFAARFIRNRVATAAVRLLLFVLALSLFPTTAQAEAPPPSPTPGTVSAPSPNGSHVQLNFGVDPGSKTAIVALVSSEPVSKLHVLVLGDLTRDDNKATLAAANVTASLTATPNGRSGTLNDITLSIRVDRQGTAPGVFSGAVFVAGDDGGSLTIPLTVTLQGGSWWIVLIIVLVGSLLGYVTKWLSDTGSALSSARQRYIRDTNQLSALWPSVPDPAKSQLSNVELALNQLDPSAASLALDVFEKNQANIAKQAGLLSDTSARLRVQRGLLLDSPNLTNGSSAIAAEQDQMSQYLRETQPDDANALTNFDTFRTQVAGFTDLLRQYPSAQGVHKQALEQAAQEYASGQFASGLQDIIATSKQAPFAMTASGAPPPPAPAGGVARVVGKAGTTLVDLQPILTPLLVAALTALLGIQTLFFANPTFGANPTDYLVSFGWGYGLQLAGTTITQIGSNLAARGPKLSS